MMRIPVAPEIVIKAKIIARSSGGGVKSGTEEEIRMKIRNGFVSNSSSSSFLVGIPADCTTFDKFINGGVYLWDMDEPSRDFMNEPVGFKEMTNRDCIQILWKDLLRGNHKADMTNWIDRVSSSYPPSCAWHAYEYDFVNAYCTPHNVRNVYEEEYAKEIAEKIEKRLEKIGKEWNFLVGEAMIRDMFDYYDDNVYEISYSDNDGELSALMEHGGFWRYVPHVSISEH